MNECNGITREDENCIIRREYFKNNGYPKEAMEDECWLIRLDYKKRMREILSEKLSDPIN